MNMLDTLGLRGAIEAAAEDTDAEIHDRFDDLDYTLENMQERMSRIESRLCQLFYALRLDPNQRYDQQNSRRN